MMIINVTKKDIKNGTPGNYNTCPIALALKRQTGRGIEVGNELHDCDTGRRKRSSTRMIRFIDRFDESKPVKPFNFRLRKFWE